MCDRYKQFTEVASWYKGFKFVYKKDIRFSRIDHSNTEYEIGQWSDDMTMLVNSGPIHGILDLKNCNFDIDSNFQWLFLEKISKEIRKSTFETINFLVNNFSTDKTFNSKEDLFELIYKYVIFQKTF